MAFRLKFYQTIMFCFCVAGTVTAEEAARTEEKSIPFMPGGTITILSEDGTVEIGGWDRNMVRIEMTYRAWGSTQQKADDRLNALQIEIIEGKNRIVVRERDRDESHSIGLFDILDGDFWKKEAWRDAKIDLNIRVPEKIRIKLQHDSGPVSIREIEGIVHLSSDEGRVQLAQIQSDEISIESDEGDVRLTEIRELQKGLCRIVVDEGDIRCEDVEIRSLDIRCDEGDLTGGAIKAEACRVETDEGRIRFSLTPHSGGRYAFSTDEGDIDLTVPDSAPLEVRLWTEEGRIQTNTDLTVRRFDEGEQLDGRLGESGQAMLKASTDEGDIRFIAE